MPYQRAERRTGHANGFKPRTLPTRLGALTVAVPQTRGVESYPSALEKGVRNERGSRAELTEAGRASRDRKALAPGKLCDVK